MAYGLQVSNSFNFFKTLEILFDLLRTFSRASSIARTYSGTSWAEHSVSPLPPSCLIPLVPLVFIVVLVLPVVATSKENVYTMGNGSRSFKLFPWDKFFFELYPWKYGSFSVNHISHDSFYDWGSLHAYHYFVKNILRRYIGWNEDRVFRNSRFDDAHNKYIKARRLDTPYFPF